MTNGTNREKVLNLMSDGYFRTLIQIQTETGICTQGISSRLRDLRLPAYGSYLVEKRKNYSGSFEYRIIVRATPKTAAA